MCSPMAKGGEDHFAHAFQRHEVAGLKRIRLV
jgi:hypothetical protein